MCSTALILQLSLLHSMIVKHMHFNSVILSDTLTREKQKQQKDSHAIEHNYPQVQEQQA